MADGRSLQEVVQDIVRESRKREIDRILALPEDDINAELRRAAELDEDARYEGWDNAPIWHVPFRHVARDVGCGSTEQEPAFYWNNKNSEWYARNATPIR